MPTNASPVLLTDVTVIYVCLLVAALGLLAIAGVVWFGIIIYRGRIRPQPPDEDSWIRIIDHWMHFGPGPNRPNIRSLLDAYSEHLERRNEFWTGYGQIIIAGLIIIVLTILLLTRSISAEAGLPVLSGISGFAIAKGVSVSRGGSNTEPEQRG